MPELPEMENYRRLLSDKIVGKKIINVRINRSKSINVPEHLFVSQLIHCEVIRIRRRAKYLLFDLNSGQVLLLHLMLGGWIHFGTETDKPKRNTQVEIEFHNDFTLYFIGLRLGFLHLLSEEMVQKELELLGPEPLSSEFSLSNFHERVKKKSGKVKLQLANQKWVAGIGNCYSDEICFDAKILPTRRMDELNNHEIENLYRSIRKVLTNASQMGGYMENPLFAGDTLTGGSDPSLMVYDRGGDRCYRCGGSIVQDQISSKKTFYCNGCQT